MWQPVIVCVDVSCSSSKCSNVWDTDNRIHMNKQRHYFRLFVCLFQRTGPCPNRPRKEQTYRFGCSFDLELGGAEHSDVAAGEALHVALVQLAVLLDGVVQPARQDVELVVVHGIEGAASWDLLHGEGDGGVIGGSGAVVVRQHRYGGASSEAQLLCLDARLHAIAGLCVLGRWGTVNDKWEPDGGWNASCQSSK